MAGAGTTSASDDHLNVLAISIDRRFEGLSLPSDCCIFTIPERLRRKNEEAYTPCVVAIGPYHRHNPSLMPMEDHKLLYLQNFLQQYKNYCLNDYIERVKSWEDEARNCYDKQIDLDSDHFAKMILLDGIFVIQLLLINWDRWRMLPNDQIFGKRWNQIPFFVVQRLFEMAFGTNQQRVPELLELVCRFFKPIMRKDKLLEGVMESDVKHFVHAISLSFWPLEGMQQLPNENLRGKKFPPRATELVASGVKLRRRESKCLNDIEFKNGVLSIPYLVLEDSTELYFRNIIVFEQCYCINMYLTEYLAVMHHLVETPSDAKLLIDKEIIENWLSNKEAATQVINKFGEGNLLRWTCLFNSLSHKLTNHCQRPCNVWKAAFYNNWKATFKRDYCSTPWVFMSVIAAVLLLLLTIVQTVCSVLSLKNLSF